jgi:transposase
MVNLNKLFNEPVNQRQKQYEVVRAIVVDKVSAKEVAKKFGYKINTIYSIVRDAKSGKLELFPEVKKGPKGRRTPKLVQEKIVKYRKKKLSSPDIHNQLDAEGIRVSIRTIERILKDSGFERLKRRTYKELRRSSKNKLIPNRSKALDFNELKPFKIDCPVAGVYLFLPYIIESGIVDILKKCNLPGSSVVGSIQASLSMLLLKLIGNERLSNMDSYDQEPGLGVFAGLNVLPKSTYMCTYSCSTSESMLLDFQREAVGIFRKKHPDFYSSQFINLDFHSIPHYGEDESMEKIWCGSRGKTLRGSNTVFAQDSKSNAILYTRADILRKEESDEIKRFVSYWKQIKGSINETLVFDCKFTKYEILDELSKDGIKFITLRKRNKSLIKNAMQISKENWSKIYLPIPKRKYQTVSVYEEKVILKNCNHAFRQIVVKDQGREKPTFIITNDKKLKIENVLEVYAKRWRIENKLSELVSFFNLNALSSPLMIRIHFDILWTLIADTFYHLFSHDLRRFEKSVAPTIFKKFINMPGTVIYDGDKFIIKIRKRSYTPILKGVKKLNLPFVVPWLNNKTVQIEWTP